ncbi:histidine kinase [Brachybacterium huguangmaarense]|uniref:Histidine kinase n=1 Tax=Brachybacterium huguangmaarense TaxID=1652028 RepID=A0ABY6G428_9MICO|nr:histidine kinase [Brachybacterium huguangmaarense]UYG17386.1 histidine kinase [Brachybacterium huguangmaarense]
MTAPTAPSRSWRVYLWYTVLGMVMFVVVIPLVIAGFLETYEPDAADALLTPGSFVLLAAQFVLSALSTWCGVLHWARSTPPRHRTDDRTILLVTGASLVPLLAAVAAALLSPAIGPATALTCAAVVAADLGSRGRAVGIAVTGVLVVGLAQLLPEHRSLVTVCAVVVTTCALLMRMTLWLGALVRELDDARTSQAALAVAEERLRFGRDLHDVAGRDLSAIAVNAELLTRLIERGDDRSAEQSRQVAALARSSLAEIRSLARGYRQADLGTELHGTVSLLRSAHIEVAVQGAADDVPAEHRATAAWVLREGGTNMLRHAAPSSVTVVLDAEGLRLSNDGVPADEGAVVESSGLTGLRERLGTGLLTTCRADGVFTLDVRFDPAAVPSAPPARSASPEDT